MKKIGIALMLTLVFFINGCGDSGNNSSTSNNLNNNEPDTIQTSEKAPFKFTKDFLKGKTFYLVENDDFGNDQVLTDWNIESFSFSDKLVSIKDYEIPNSKEESFSYRVEENGSIDIIFLEGDDSENSNWIISPIDKNDTTIIVVDESGTIGYLFLDENHAKTFRDTKNSESSINGFNKELLDGKKFYLVEQKETDNNKNTNMKWSISKVEFHDNQMFFIPMYQNLQENTSIFSYSIEDNGSNIIATNSENGSSLIFKFENSSKKAIHIKIGEIDNTNIKELRDAYFIYNKVTAKIFINAQNGIEEN
jgi:hypothetical protein